MSALAVSILAVGAAVVATQVGPWWLAAALWVVVTLGIARGLARDE